MVIDWMVDVEKIGWIMLKDGWVLFVMFIVVLLCLVIMLIVKII